MRRFRFMSCWWVLTVLLATGSAFAEPKNPPNAVQQARIECAAGNYQAGVRLLAERWVATKETVLVYNQARCYEQNNQNELAASRFREYLRVEKSLPPDEVNAIKKRIEELQPAAPQAPSPIATPNVAQPLPAGPAPTEATALPPPGLSPTSTALPPPGLSLTSTAPPEPTAPIYKRWWFWTGAGAVVAGGVVTAILLGTKSAPKSPNCSVGALCANQN
jgi:hypothetical protein